MMAWMRAIFVGGICLATALGSRTGLSQEADAAGLARQAETLLSQGKTQEACEHLERSLLAEPRSATAMDLGYCYEKLKKKGLACRAYAYAEALAASDGRKDRKAEAARKLKALGAILPRVTVTVANPERYPDLVIAVDGRPLRATELDKLVAVDAGSTAVTVSAPGYEPWSETISLQAFGRKTLAVGELTKTSQPVASATPIPNTEEPEPAPQALPEPSEPEGSQASGKHSFVFELGVFTGAMFSSGARGEPQNPASLTFETKNALGHYQVRGCDIAECEAVYRSAGGALVGANAFVGLALEENLHLGLRGFGAPSMGGGYLLAGGPAVSWRVLEHLWIGAGALVGQVEHEADIESVRAQVPEEDAPYNDASEVDVPIGAGFTRHAPLSTGVAVGGSLEVSLPLARVQEGWLSGSFLLSAWPAILVGLDSGGLQVAVPVGFSYRRH